MGAGASKTARRLPTKVPTSAHANPTAAVRPSAEALAAAEKPAGQALDYGKKGKPGKEAEPFSGEKDEDILKDGMDPDFMAKLQRLGPVAIDDPSRIVRTPIGAQRTLNARRPEYTNRTNVPPPGTLTVSMLTGLLDQLKTLPPGADPTHLYRQYGMTPELLAPVRQWVNSPSVGDEEYKMMDRSENQTVETEIEMPAVWVESKDKLAPPKN